MKPLSAVSEACAAVRTHNADWRKSYALIQESFARVERIRRG